MPKEDKKRVWVNEDLLEGLRVNCMDLALLNPTQEFRLKKHKRLPSDSELVESALISFFRSRLRESTQRPKKGHGVDSENLTKDGYISMEHI